MSIAHPASTPTFTLPMSPHSMPMYRATSTRRAFRTARRSCRKCTAPELAEIDTVPVIPRIPMLVLAGRPCTTTTALRHRRIGLRDQGSRRRVPAAPSRLLRRLPWPPTLAVLSDPAGQCIVMASLEGRIDGIGKVPLRQRSLLQPASPCLRITPMAMVAATPHDTAGHGKASIGRGWKMLSDARSRMAHRGLLRLWRVRQSMGLVRIRMDMVW